MTLTGEAILNMNIEILTKKNTGINNLITELDKIHSKEESSQAYDAYKTFETVIFKG